ncbi:MAG: hypothetical protein ABI177_04360 [Edaphobacter sp.]
MDPTHRGKAAMDGAPERFPPGWTLGKTKTKYRGLSAVAASAPPSVEMTAFAARFALVEMM